MCNAQGKNRAELWRPALGTMFCLKKIQASSWVLGSFPLHLSVHLLIRPQLTCHFLPVLPPSLHQSLPLCLVSLSALSPQRGACATFSLDPRSTSDYCLPSPHTLVLWEPPLLPHLPVIPQAPTIFNSPHHSIGGSAGKESDCSAADLGLILGWENPLEEEMATHSSILTWRIPWTEEPGGLQSKGSQRDTLTFITPLNLPSLVSRPDPITIKQTGTFPPCLISASSQHWVLWAQGHPWWMTSGAPPA